MLLASRNLCHSRRAAGASGKPGVKGRTLSRHVAPGFPLCASLGGNDTRAGAPVLRDATLRVAPQDEGSFANCRKPAEAVILRSAVRRVSKDGGVRPESATKERLS